MKIKLIILFCLISIIDKTYCQNESKLENNFGIRYSYYYNNNIVHHTPTLFVGLKRHNLYIGPEYSIILNPIKGDPTDTYEKSTWGLNVGYRYYSKELAKNFSLFGQFNFSLYQINYTVYQIGPPFTNEHSELIVENTATIGADYKLFNSFNLFAGIGIGSYGGFFLLLDEFTFSSYMGIQYKF